MPKKYSVKDNEKTNARKNKKYNIDNLESVEKTKRKKPETTSLKNLYRYMNGEDIVLLLVAVLMSLGLGVAFSMNIFVFSNVITLIVKPKNTKDTYVHLLGDEVNHFAIIAGCAALAGFVQAVAIYVLGERVKRRLKYNFFAALLRQDVTWFDRQQTGRLITHITDDIDTIEAAITEKLINFIQQIGTFIVGLVMALVTHPLLAIIGLSVLPLMFFVFFFLIRFVKTLAIAQVKAYSIAGGIAEEILSGLKTVVAFNAIESEVKRYVVNLTEAETYGIKKSVIQGIAGGIIGLLVWCGASLVFYTGLGFYLQGTIEPGKVILVFFNVVMGSVALGNAIPMIDVLIQATAAGYPLFQIIDRKPQIDINDKGDILETFCGDIEFRNISFEYPTRPGVQILKDFSFTIPQGKRVAFIGPSGSGKSTIIHLLQRFYDPNSGSVNLNGHDIRALDLQWYRSKIGVVHQEPPLFSGSIGDNIRLGKLDATDVEIAEAAKKSNAYEFIMQTKQQFETKLGDMGSGFSGGQKQRIAIATALIGNRSLLLLDEATSALDTVSEKQVQETIDENLSAAGNTVTVVMVAHRLQTVRNADIIVVMKPGGEIVEHGNHDELMEMQGMYYEMLQKQNVKHKITPDAIEGEEEIDSDEEDTRKSIDYGRRKSRNLSIFEIEEIQKKSHFQTLRDFHNIMTLNKPESFYLTVGAFGAMFIGIVYPYGSLIYAQLFQIFKEFEISNKTKVAAFQRDRNYFCGLLLLPGLCLLIGNIVKNICFGKSGEVLTTRLRQLLLTSILRQEMAWFDEPAHQPGVLVSRLASEATQVKGAAGLQIGIFFEAGACLLAAILIGFRYSWELTLLFFLLIPMITIAGIMQGRNTHGTSSDGDENNEGGSIGLVLESLNNIRTVHSLNLHQHTILRFRSFLQPNERKRIIKLLMYGIFGSIGTCAVFVTYCIIFRVGASLMDAGRIVMIQLMRVFACLNMSSASLGRALAMSPDVEKARLATRLILSTINRESLIDPLSTDGINIKDQEFKGKIDIHGIRFRYPSRRNVLVLQGLNATIDPQQSVALVGHSGCGKSTVIQLLLRFYEARPGSGSVTLDGYDLRCLNVRWLRSQIGLVQQEPRLFNISVTDNICLGLTKEEVDMERVKVVAKAANIHDFITTLPEGYDTRVGQRGGHLSGGQKQRLCIARALYREPALLLLDEATSALDNESEAVVQEALNAASQGRTSVTVAHRLTTVRDCDSILVLERGRVAEAGSHDQLMAHRGGIYNRLYCGSADST